MLKLILIIAYIISLIMLGGYDFYLLGRIWHGEGEKLWNHYGILICIIIICVMFYKILEV